MEHKGLEIVSLAALKKVTFFRYKWRYAIYSMLAGAFCSIGMAFAYTVGAIFYFSIPTAPDSGDLYKLGIGIAFSLSFTLIIFAGCELFTSNVLVMSTGVLNKTVRFGDAFALLLFCYAFNLFGAAFMAFVVGMTGLLDGNIGRLVLESSIAKTSIPFSQAFFRGVMCNVLVCLGYWAMAKTKSETAKLIIIVWVVAGFVTPGYEHSIANTGIFTMSRFTPSITKDLTMIGILSNMISVTMGNIAGGALLVAWPYWVSGGNLFGSANEN